MDLPRIIVSTDTTSVFYHVAGDKRRYLDLYALIRNHSELERLINDNWYQLQEQFIQKQATLKHFMPLRREYEKEN